MPELYADPEPLVPPRAPCVHPPPWCVPVKLDESPLNSRSSIWIDNPEFYSQVVKFLGMKSGLSLNLGSRRDTCISCIERQWGNFSQLKHTEDFPGGTVDKNLPANAGDMGSVPGPGRFHILQSNKAHGPQLPSPWAAATESHMPRAHALQEKPPQWEACAPQ